MALLTRLRANSQFGVLDTEADGVTQTLSSPEFASLPVVGAGQFLVLILDPEKENGAAEIVHVTAHTSGATTVTVVRGREVTTGRVHPAGTVWRHGPTTYDFGEGFQTLTDVAVVFGAGASIEEGSEDHVVLGYKAKAGANTTGGGAATAVGSFADARGDYSVVVGMATAEHEEDIAIGSGAYAWHDVTEPDAAVAIGEFADARGGGAVAIGPAVAWATTTSAGAPIAIGRYAYAYGDSSIAIGNNALTHLNLSQHWDRAIAIGTAFARGTGAIAIGDNASHQADAHGSVALGQNARGNGLASTAVGQGAQASADAVALGRSAAADGEDSIAIGTITLVTAQGATGVGHGTRVEGIRATALGEDATAMNDDSTALGTGASTTKTNQVMLGHDGDVTTMPGGVEVAVNRVSANYTMDGPANDRVILADAGAGAVTVTLIAAAGNEGRVVTIKKVDASANAVTIDGSGTETIDGAATQVLSAQYEDITVVCDGTAWFIIG